MMEVCVMGVPDDRWGEAVKAVCVLRPGAQLNKAELAAFVSSRLAGYKKPRHIVYVKSLPKTVGGVIDRTAVKRAYAQPPRDRP